MPNPFEALWNTLKSLAETTPTTPLHVGEVMGLWTYFTALKEMIRFEEIGLNTTKDDEVFRALQDAHKMCGSQAKRLENFLLKEGVPLSNTSPPKPMGEVEVPPEICLSDDELTNGVSIKVASSIVETATGQAQAIRADVGILWAELQSEMLSFSATLKQLMKKRGWLKIPPYYSSPGEQKNTKD